MPAVLLVSLLEVVQSPFPLVLAQGFEGILVSLTGLFIGRLFLFFLREDGRENKNHRQTHEGKSHGKPPHNPSTWRWGAKKIEHTAESSFCIEILRMPLYVDSEHQSRSARAGSVRVARQAGRSEAAKAARIITRNAGPNASGSPGPTL